MTVGQRLSSSTISVDDYGDDYDGRVGCSLAVIRSRRRSRQPSPPGRGLPAALPGYCTGRQVQAGVRVAGYARIRLWACG